MVQEDTQAPRRNFKLRRVRALLAGGLVLGLGAVAVEAAWTDTEYGSATLTAGTFNIQSSVDAGTTWVDSTEANPAVFTMSAGAQSLVPGSAAYGLFSIRTANPSMAGTIELTAGANNESGLGQYLTYGVRVIGNNATCDATGFAAGTSVVATGSSLSADATQTQSLAANGGDRVNYCFEFRLPTGTPNAAQGQTINARWLVTGTSAAS